MKEFISRNKKFISFYTFLSIIFYVFSSSSVFLLFLAIEKLTSENEKTLFFVYLLIIVAIVLLSTLIKYFLNFFKIKNTEKNILFYKSRISNKIANLKHEDFIEEEKRSGFLSWFNKDTEIIRINLNIFYSFIDNTLSFVINVSFIFFFSWIIGLWVLLFFITTFIIMNFFVKYFQKLYKKMSAFHVLYNSKLSITLQNFNTLFLFGKTNKIKELLNEHSNEFYENEINFIKRVVLISYLMYIWLFAFRIFTIFLSLLLAFLGYIRYEYLISLIIYTSHIYHSIMFFLDGYPNYVGTIFSLTKHKDEKINYNESPKNNHFESLKIKNIYFSYGDKKIFNNFSLDIQKNKKYAIIGKSGAGKSTLINLIMGVTKPEKGSIELNGKKYTPEDFLTISSIINNKNYIFNDSIENNISLWSEIEQTGKEKIENLLEEFNISKISDQKINDNDNKISEGEKQRIALSRFFFNEKKVLVLDEALSNLDRKNREIIFEKIMNKKNITLIFISHNFSKKEIEKFDYIINLKEVKNEK